MSATITLPLRPAHAEARTHILFVRLTTVALVIYPFLLMWFTAPSKFLDDHSYEAQLHGPRISADALPLELPKDADALALTLRANDSHEVHEAQLKLDRRALAWDYFFIEIYVLQFIGLALLAEPAGARRLFQALTISSILIAGIFDWLENFRIAEILNPGGPDFGDLIARVTKVSTVKWTAIFVACSMLIPLVRSLPDTGRKFRIALTTALIAASATGFAGIVPGHHNLLQPALGLYGVVPVLILWRFVLDPAIDAVDKRLRESAGPTEQTAPKWSLDKLDSPSGSKPVEAEKSNQV